MRHRRLLTDAERESARFIPQPPLTGNAKVPTRPKMLCPSPAQLTEKAGVSPSPMNVVIKTPEQIEQMREAGKLAAEIAERIGEYVKPVVTTE